MLYFPSEVLHINKVKKDIHVIIHVRNPFKYFSINLAGKQNQTFYILIANLPFIR